MGYPEVMPPARTFDDVGQKSPSGKFELAQRDSKRISLHSCSEAAVIKT